MNNMAGKIEGGRRSGKAFAMLVEASARRGTVICSSIKRKNELARTAKDLGLRSPKIVVAKNECIRDED